MSRVVSIVIAGYTPLLTQHSIKLEEIVLLGVNMSTELEECHEYVDFIHSGFR